MKTKISLFSIFMLFMFFQANAQKKPLTHDVYDDWKSLQSTSISNDGNWVAYRISPQVGDGVLEIKNLTNNKTMSIERVGRYSFTKNSDYVVASVGPEYAKERELKLKKTSNAKMPKDSLYIINLKSGEMKKVARVKNYQLPNESTEWMAWLHETPLEEKGKKEGEEETKKPKSKSKGTELVVFNMVSGNENRFEGVVEYEMTQKGNFVYIEKDEADSLNPATVMAFNTKSGKTTTLNSGLEDYKRLTTTEDGEQVVFFATNSGSKRRRQVL